MNKKGLSTLRKFENILRIKNYSERSITIYCNYVNKFILYFDCDPYHISKSKAVKYLHNNKFNSVSQQNQIISSIKLFYKYIIKSSLNDINFERPRKEKHLPKIIDKGYLINKISGITNLKHKAILSLGYSVGLRVSEVCNLEIKDIDSKRMIIMVRQSKGRKDRIVPLTENVLSLLRWYYIQYKPKEYLFNGQNSLKYTPTSCNKIVKKYLGEQYHFHLLRHATFTHLTDQGVDIRAIQKLAGHQSSRTTEIYTQVSTQVLSKLPLSI